MPKTSNAERQNRANREYGTKLIVERATANAPRGTKAELARALGVTPTHITSIAQGKRGVSDDLVARLVENVLHQDWEDFRREALEWIKDEKRQKHDALDESENRAVATRAARVIPLLPEAVSSVLAEPVPAPDHTAQAWLSRMIMRDTDLRVSQMAVTAKAPKPARRPK